jgi:hypothetical protein
LIRDKSPADVINGLGNQRFLDVALKLDYYFIGDICRMRRVLLMYGDVRNLA